MAGLHVFGKWTLKHYDGTVICRGEYQICVDVMKSIVASVTPIRFSTGINNSIVEVGYGLDGSTSPLFTMSVSDI